MARTTDGKEVSFDGKHLSERKRKSEWSTPVAAISSLEFDEFSWLTRPPLAPKDAKYFLKVTYGQPVDKWDGSAMASRAEHREWYFPKDQGTAARSLHQALRRFTG